MESFVYGNNVMNVRTVTIIAHVLNWAAHNGIAALPPLAASPTGSAKRRADGEGLPSSAGNAARRYS